MRTDNMKFKILADNVANTNESVDRRPLKLINKNVSNSHGNSSKKAAVKTEKFIDLCLGDQPEENQPEKVTTCEQETQTLESPPPEKKEVKPKINLVTVEDLTSEGNPGEHYWELMAEKRREILERTLNQNKLLHERVELLEQQLKLKDEMLNEAKAMADILKGLLGDD